MGTFDESIAWCRKRREVALGEYNDYAAGRQRISMNGFDVTEQMMDRARRDVEQFNILIAAYEAKDAQAGQAGSVSEG
jgi:hypothetical protein